MLGALQERLPDQIQRLLKPLCELFSQLSFSIVFQDVSASMFCSSRSCSRSMLGMTSCFAGHCR